MAEVLWEEDSEVVAFQEEVVSQGEGEGEALEHIIILIIDMPELIRFIEITKKYIKGKQNKIYYKKKKKKNMKSNFRNEK